MTRLGRLKGRRYRRRRRRRPMQPAYVVNDLSRQRGWMRGLREKVFKRRHRLKPKDE